MRLIIAICLFLTSLNCYPQTKYKTYYNNRFLFSVKYPNFLIPQGESNNGDGQRFVSKDKKITLRTTASYYPPSSKGLYHSYLAYSTDSSTTKETFYKIYKGNWYVISKILGSNINYEKVVMYSNKNGETVYKTLTFVYPKARKKELDDIVNTVAISFK
ncbi:hypothetical protein [Adhaeribacter radiodurans]|uniref:Uncharacterized protein n=1 Tax=Adhaeribacter radiodurans TaxID=2745197 RepID=A0A7L7L179_9BACT|nr:hypothetical protein [Adhaeribacter radiodurans]QMU26548.1 hypothetical protein HUW48_00310 [Adhaeribacter radiodurans]